MKPQPKNRVGEMRPSQILFSSGVGAVIDLPHLSTMVLGLDDWDVTRSTEIGEDRLRTAVQAELQSPVSRLLTPPIAPDNGTSASWDPTTQVGVPVATFPRWVVCPYCHLLAPLNSGLFQLKTNSFRPDLTAYVHVNCSASKPPSVLPARFLLACPRGHLDDFPWLYFVHGSETSCKGPLRLLEQGVSGEAADIIVRCEAPGCDQDRKRSMAQAFGQEGKESLPPCSARRPHLRDYDPDGCPDAQERRAILLGASNSWFPLQLTVLSVPIAPDKLGQLVDTQWHQLEKAANLQNIEFMRSLNMMPDFAAYSDAAVWEAIEKKRAGAAENDPAPALKTPEWQVFTNPTEHQQSDDFRAAVVAPPPSYSRLVEQVVLIERLREVRALIGFTRIQSPGEFGEIEEFPPDRRAKLSRKAPQWVPAGEVRGEGIFIQFAEDAVQQWETSTSALIERGYRFQSSHREWRRQRHLDPDRGFPGLRFFLLHSFSHALMRQFALEAGYSAASIRERIYSLPATDPEGPMAGVLIYTAAPDSEGTLGGLVRLGVPLELERHVTGALSAMGLCAADPLCAEHLPTADSAVLHGAACHACLFAPETSCERGNKYLDRTLLVPTVENSDLAFFPEVGV